MKEYNYHPIYKQYISSNDVFISPLDNREYLVSANATLIEPPQVESGKVQIFNENTKKWEIINDFRGWYYNIFNGEKIYNEIPNIKPKNHTDIAPPEDYNLTDYKWTSETKKWEKINPIYKVSEDRIKYLSAEEKLSILNISIEELKQLLNLNNVNNSISEELDKIQNLYSSFDSITNACLVEKLNLLNIDNKDLKNYLNFDEIITQNTINEIKSLPLNEKLNIFNINIDELKVLLKINCLEKEYSHLQANLNLLNYQIIHYKNVVSDALSNIPSQYIKPINFSEITILRPIEIIQTSEKFLTDDDILPSGFVGICIDTGERKFGDSITTWTKLPYVNQDQRFRFSKTLKEWQDQNPIPGADIECYEIDTDKIKIGNGFLPWEKLPYEGA
jgi:hypothetical protein